MSTATLTVTNPASGEVFAELPWGGEAEARKALDQADTAFSDWSTRTARVRADTLRHAAGRLREKDLAEEFSLLITRETGKRLQESRAEVGLSADFLDWFAAAVYTQPGAKWAVTPGIEHLVESLPLGVVAVLTPWNFPLSIPVRKIAAALAAGCTVVFKPSEIAPLSALRLTEILQEALPPGVLNTVVGEPHAVAKAWLGDGRLRGLTFTGSTTTGLALAAQALPGMTRTVLELGGCAPFVVLDDADLDRAVELLAVAKYRNNGQSCIAANHAWVPRHRFDAFVEAFAAVSADLVIGDPTDPKTTLGPVTLPGDPERLQHLVADAQAHGARILQCGSAPEGPGQYFAPQLCVDPDPSARVTTEEIFGPVLAVRPYDDLATVVGLTRASSYGLAGFVVGQDTVRAAGVARSLEVGIAGVNTATPNTPQVPFGGLKLSGLGWEGSLAGLAAFQRIQTLAVA